MRVVCEKPAVHLIINAEAFEICHTHRNSINARLKVSRGFCRNEQARTAYLEEARVILINSVGGRDDDAHHPFHIALRCNVPVVYTRTFSSHSSRNSMISLHSIRFPRCSLIKISGLMTSVSSRLYVTRLRAFTSSIVDDRMI